MVSVVIIIKPSEAEKQTPIDTELFNGDSTFGWQVSVIFFEVGHSTGTILIEK